MKYNTILAAIFLLALLLILSLPGKAQSKNPKPLTVKVEFIEKVEKGFEVWVKHHDPHYRYRSFHLVKVFEVLPDSIKIGNTIILYPSDDKNQFQIVTKQSF